MFVLRSFHVDANMGVKLFQSICGSVVLSLRLSLSLSVKRERERGGGGGGRERGERGDRQTNR